MRRNFKEHLCWVLLLVFMTAFIAGCGGSKTETGGGGDEVSVNINIGVVEPLTGSMAPLGTAEYGAFEMAVEMINEKGGVMGQYPITYVTADSQSDAGIGASEAERLITSNKVPVIFGSYSSAIASAISEVTERNKTVLWEMSGSADSILSRGYQWVFRNESNASAWGAESVEFVVAHQDEIKEKLGKNLDDLVIAIIHEDGPYGTAVADGNYATAVNKYDLNVAINEAYSSSAVDLSSVILKIKNTNPDVLFMTSYVNDAILFNRQAKELGFTVPILITHSGGHSVQAFADGVGVDANYMLTVDPVPCNPKLDAFSPENQQLFNEFVKRWTEKYGYAPYHHVEARWFAQCILFFNEIAPVAIEQFGGFNSETIANAIRSVDIPADRSLMGHGAKFSTPQEPWIDPWLGNKHTGQNIKANAFINQYFDGGLYCVWPENLAQKEAVLFLPPDHPLARK